ncbi:MAG: protein kinase [Acidobacteriota bacterium]
MAVRSSSKSASEPLSLGSIVGHYVVQQQIGAGSGGVVYRAFDHRLQRAVALKILDLCLLGEDATWAQAVSEARAVGSLAHPNICAVFDVEEEDEHVYLAMELVEGRSLHTAIPGHGLACEATMRYGAQIASALAHAHDKGVCHGDVSARNVMLTLDDRVKVLDFGLARLLAKSNSPAEPSEGARRDLQQLGILLCQMATGVFPPRALDVLLGTAPPSAVLESAPFASLPEGLRSVIARCLDPDPARSYQRAQQATADLEDGVQLARMRPAGPARAFRWRGAALAAAALLIAALLVIVPRSVRKAPEGVAARGTASPLQEAPAKPLPAHRPTVVARPDVHHTAKPVQAAPAKPHPARAPGSAANPDARVWANTKSKVYHCSNSALYGKTQHGRYMTQAQARAAGYHPARNELCR